jgi:hypothetical protein
MIFKTIVHLVGFLFIVVIVMYFPLRLLLEYIIINVFFNSFTATAPVCVSRTLWMYGVCFMCSIEVATKSNNYLTRFWCEKKI